MRMTLDMSLWRLAPVALMAALACHAGIASSQQPEPDPDPELAAEDEDEAEFEEEVEEEFEEGFDEEAQGPDAEADETGLDEAEDEWEEELAALSDADWEPDPMDEDEEWVTEILADESDDAIPIDSELDPTGLDWEVTEFVDDGDNMEDVPVTVTEGDWDTGDMPTIRRPARVSRPAGAGDEDVPYSTGGKPIRAGGAPWQAQIYYPRQAAKWAEKLANGTPLWQLQHYCGGTLIAPDWVLTAAHCIDDGMVKAGYRVRLGVQDISKDEGWSYKIDRIVRHSRYAGKKLPEVPNMYANDIALVHIVEDVPQKPRDPERIRAIPLYERAVPAGAEVTGTGWGKTEAVEGHAPSAVLMKVDLRVMDTDRCKKLPGYGPQKIHERVICAAHPERSTCQGDSGGAITLTNGAPVVVGVVSWGKKRCSGDGQPGAYTRVENYLGWIRQAMLLDPSRGSLP